MFKAFFFFVFSFLPFTVQAADSVEEIEEMGNLAGIIMKCKAYRSLYQFEEILSRYYSNTSSSEDAEKIKLRQYATAKAKTFSLFFKRDVDCIEAVNEFTKMPIFKTELYSDGSLRMPDGKFLYPRGQKKLAAGAEKIYPVKKR